MNKNLIDDIKSEIALCNSEITKCNLESIRISERRTNYDDRKTMLENLLEIARKEGENSD